MKKLFKSKKVIAIVVVILIIVIVLVMRFTGKGTSAMPTGFITPSTVEVRDLSETIALTGTIQGQGVTNVTSLAAAKFTEVNVAVGDTVEAGQVLAVLDPEDIKTQIKEVSENIGNSNELKKMTNAQLVNNIARAEYDKNVSLNNAQKAVDRASSSADAIWSALSSDKAALEKYNKLKTAKDKTQKDYDDAAAALTQAETDGMDTSSQEYQDLVDAKTEAETKKDEAASAFNTYAPTVDPEALALSIAKNESLMTEANQAVEDAKSAYDSTVVRENRNIDAAETAFDQSKYASKDYSASDMLKELKAQLEDCTLKAPISGVVTSVKVAVGDKNAPGVAIITIEDTSNLVFSATVDEKDIMKLSEGMTSTLTTTATDDAINGTITRIVRVKQVGADGSGGYPVEITIDNHNLLLGMNAKARIVMKERKGILSVPYDHIQEDESGKTFVMVAVPSGEGASATYTASKKYVTVGEEINYFTEITGGELKEGDLTFYDSSVSEGDVVILDTFNWTEE